MPDAFPTIKAVDRIVSAAGIEPRQGRERFRSALKYAFDRFMGYRKLDATSRRVGFKDLAKVRSGARQLRSYLQDPDRKDVLREHLVTMATAVGKRRGGYAELGLIPASSEYLYEDIDDETGEENNVFVAHLDVQAEQAVERAIAAVSLIFEWAAEAKTVEKPQKHDIAPEVRLIGHILPKLYLDHFGRELSINIDVKSTGASGLRFMMTTLAEARKAGFSKLHFSEQTIKKYHSQGKRNLRRRTSR